MRWPILAALLLVPVAAGAQGLDMSKGGPVEVTSRDGIEWRQNEQVVVAKGDAHAVRADTTVIADTLTAHYRRKATPAGAAPRPSSPASAPGSTPAAAQAAPAAEAAPAAAPAPPPTSGSGGPDTGNNEIYRLEADGNVKIFNQTDLAVGDHAIYDMDQAVLLLTGKTMSLTTPQQVFTARDTMEWWSQKHMAVGRGLATVTTSDGRFLGGDVLVGYTTPPGAAPVAPKPTQVAAKPGSSDPMTGATGKLQRVEAFGHVVVRTATETVTGERAVYVADTGMARIAGNVHITRGQNVADGDEALTNMKTGISTLIRYPGKRVQGVVVPSDTTKDPANATTKPPPKK